MKKIIAALHKDAQSCKKISNILKLRSNNVAIGP